MAKPPMPDKVTLHQAVIGEDGLPETDRYGQASRSSIVSAARVKYTTGTEFSDRQEEGQTRLEISFPPETQVHAGDEVEWVDRFGKTVKESILAISEVLSYNGKVVYYRKVKAGKPWSGS